MNLVALQSAIRHTPAEYAAAPLGCIPTPELKDARQHLHKLIDPAWKSGLIRRGDLYEAISKEVGWKYHTAKTRSVDEARIAYRAAQKIIQSLPHQLAK